jgi:hypothetical protein
MPLGAALEATARVCLDPEMYPLLDPVPRLPLDCSVLCAVVMGALLGIASNEFCGALEEESWAETEDEGGDDGLDGGGVAEEALDHEDAVSMDGDGWG